MSLPARMSRLDVFSSERWVCRLVESGKLAASCWPWRIQLVMSVGVAPAAGLNVCVCRVR